MQDWNQIDQLVRELIEAQQRKLLASSRCFIPHLTSDDILQPNDFMELEHNPYFRYEEGMLAGLQTVQMALRAMRRDVESK